MLAKPTSPEKKLTLNEDNLIKKHLSLKHFALFYWNFFHSLSV